MEEETEKMEEETEKMVRRGLSFYAGENAGGKRQMTFAIAAREEERSMSVFFFSFFFLPKVNIMFRNNSKYYWFFIGLCQAFSLLIRRTFSYKHFIIVLRGQLY